MSTPDKVEDELREQIAKLRTATGCVDRPAEPESESRLEPESESESVELTVEVQHVLQMPKEALVWMQNCEVNNQKFHAELQRRIRSDQPVTYVPDGNTLTMLCEERVIFSAKRTLLGLHACRTVGTSDPEVLSGGIAAGTYHTWMWPWTVYEDEERAQELKPQVDAMTEMDHHRRDISMFQDAITLRFILAVLCKNLGYEHVLPISPEGASDLDHIFGLKEIQYGAIPEKAETPAKQD